MDGGGGSTLRSAQLKQAVGRGQRAPQVGVEHQAVRCGTPGVVDAAGGQKETVGRGIDVVHPVVQLNGGAKTLFFVVYDVVCTVGAIGRVRGRGITTKIRRLAVREGTR